MLGKSYMNPRNNLGPNCREVTDRATIGIENTVPVTANMAPNTADNVVLAVSVVVRIQFPSRPGRRPPRCQDTRPVPGGIWSIDAALNTAVERAVRVQTGPSHPCFGTPTASVVSRMQDQAVPGAGVGMRNSMLS